MGAKFDQIYLVGNKCMWRTKSGQMSHIALCIVKYIHEKSKYINIYCKLKDFF